MVILFCTHGNGNHYSQTVVIKKLLTILNSPMLCESQTAR